MGFWIFLFVCNLLVPLTMIFFGYKFRKASRKINSTYGYRTKASMKNENTWQFAHQYCSIIWRRAGWIMLVVTIICTALSYPLSDDGQGFVSMFLVLAQTAILLATIIPVERALKRMFDENGNLRKGEE